MKAILTTALALSIPAVQADISMGSGVPISIPAEQPKAPQDAEEYLSIAKEVLEIVKELTGVLAGVKDTASADAAAPQITPLTTKLISLQKKSEAMPRPGSEVEQLVRANINVQEVQQVVGSFLESFIRIGTNNGYGSEALLNALSPVLNAMPGREE